jgi:hypothetical protein
MGKYEPLQHYLEALDDERVTLSFDSLAEIVGDSLPASAHEYASWWANDPSHVEAKAWLDAGFESACISFVAETVTFIRVGAACLS